MDAFVFHVSERFCSFGYMNSGSSLVRQFWVRVTISMNDLYTCDITSSEEIGKVESIF